MTTTELETQNKKPVSAWKVKALGLLTGASGLLVASASAIDLTGVTAIIEDVTLLFPALVATVIAIVPILIVLAIVGFVTGLFDNILGRIRL